jgi:hypothetical protein
MPIKLGKFDFQGPFASTRILRNDPGVFAVVCMWKGTTILLDAGEAEDIRRCLENHDRKEEWRDAAQEKIMGYAVLYTPDSEVKRRHRIEKEIRNRYDIPGRL